MAGRLLQCLGLVQVQDFTLCRVVTIEERALIGYLVNICCGTPALLVGLHSAFWSKASRLRFILIDLKFFTLYSEITPSYSIFPKRWKEAILVFTL